MPESIVPPEIGLSTRTLADSPARQAALDWLMGRINYERTAVIPYQERQLKLDRMRQLLTRLGQPDAGLKIVHVAGTKGKGSTSAMIAAMLTSAGYRTGLFSSPHLERIEERFAVDGEPCAPDELVALVDRLRPVVMAADDEARNDGDASGGATYFESTTAMALVHFVERRVDAAVLEVGLGGRLDATNVCLPAVCVITSISFDHMKQLGNTLASIAREKAGIIKPGIPVICGVVAPEPRRVIAQIAREHGCRLIQRGREFQFRYRPAESRSRSAARAPQSRLDFSYRVAGQEHELRDLRLAMRGAHQAANAAVALATIAELRHQGWCVSTQGVRLGLSRANLPGRVEVVSSNPLVVLDTAHNGASARALVESLAELPMPSRRTVVLSISCDKDARAIAHELVRYFDRFVLTQYQENPRALPAESLAQTVHSVLAGRPAELHAFDAPSAAWRFVQESAQSRELICITGSFFLASELRSLASGR